jgi:hypothetical protein
MEGSFVQKLASENEPKKIVENEPHAGPLWDLTKVVSIDPTFENLRGGGQDPWYPPLDPRISINGSVLKLCYQR